MTQLKCDAVRCLNNCDCRCCRPDIQVGGADATDRKDTCCENFRCCEVGATNSTGYSRPNEQMPIRCNATNCVHNRSNTCQAESIQMGKHSAEKMCDTTCETFRCR